MTDILYVEDWEPLTKLVSNTLKRYGYSVDVRQDGQEAFRAATRESYKLALVDLCMPGWDGLEALKSLHMVCPQLRAIVLSAYIDDKMEEVLLELPNVICWLKKPFSMAELERAVTRELQMHPIAAAAAL
ncbi:MAG: response regulator [Planctomycetes bacterium]|nr:response regulator [Planctomycetota bacterium]